MLFVLAVGVVNLFLHHVTREVEHADSNGDEGNPVVKPKRNATRVISQNWIMLNSVYYYLLVYQYNKEP